MVRIAIE